MDKITQCIPVGMFDVFIKNVSFPGVVDYVYMSGEQRERIKAEIDNKLKAFSASLSSIVFDISTLGPAK
jgi:hypothetical protein